MANEFKIKRGDGAPNNGSIENYELVYDYTNNDLWTKHGGQVYKVASGNVGTVTNVVAGNGLTGGGTSTATLDVGAGTGISVSSNAIAVSGLTVSEFAANSIQLSSESFADNNTSLMTSAAIADKIEAYGYSTGAGNVDTSGSPVDNDYAKFTDANTIEGRSIAEMKLDLNFGTLADLDSVGASQITDNSVGAAELNVSGNGSVGHVLKSDGDGSFSWVSQTDTNTTYTAGTGLDLSSTEFSVDVSDFMANGSNNYVLTATGTDAFRGEGNLTFDGSTLAVTGALTTTSSITPGSIVLGGHSFNDIDIGSEFVDADDHLMSSGAIKEKIESYGYATSTGDITGVTAGTGLSGGGNSGGVTLNVDVGDLGLVGNGSLDNQTNTAAEYAALPVGYSKMMHTSLGVDGGMPLDSKYFFFHKVANRDSGGGWGGLAFAYSEPHLAYLGATTVSSSLATWHKILVENASGNVGINKVSPSYKLDVNRSDAGIIAQFQYGTDTDGRIQIYADANAGSIGNDSGLAGETIYFQDDVGLRFYTGGAEAWRMTTSRTLQGNNAAITGVAGIYGNSGTLNLYNSTTYFKDTSSNVMATLNSSGLMLKNNTFFRAEDADGDDINILGIHSNNNCYIGPSTNAWAGGAMLYGAASGTNAHVWYEGDAERMRIADNGYLGIATNSPLATLDLGSAGGEKFYVYCNGASVRNGLGIDMSGTSRELSYFHSSSNASDGQHSWGYRLESNGSYVERMKLTGAGILTVSGTGGFTIGNVSGAARIQQASNEFSFLTTGNAYANIYTNDIIANGKIIHYGDTNTYMQFSAADTWKVYAGGQNPLTAIANRVYINAAGANGLLINNDEGASQNSARIFFEGTSTGCIMQEVNDLSFRTGATTGSSSGTERFRVHSSGATAEGDFNTTGSYKMDGTTIMNSSKALTNLYNPFKDGIDDLNESTLVTDYAAVTSPTSTGWYTIASASSANARGGGIISISLTGGYFGPRNFTCDFQVDWSGNLMRCNIVNQQYDIEKVRLIETGSTTELQAYFNISTDQGNNSQSMHVSFTHDKYNPNYSIEDPLTQEGSPAVTGEEITANGNTFYGSEPDDFKVYNSHVVFNEASIDVDFRVESNNSAQMLFVDGGNDRVGINRNDPSYRLDVAGDARFTADIKSEGRVMAQNGTAAAPAYSFTSQGDAGMTRVGNGVGFSADDYSRVEIDAEKMFFRYNSTSNSTTGACRLQWPNDQRIFDNGGGGLKLGAASYAVNIYSGTSSDMITFHNGGISGAETARITPTGLELANTKKLVLDGAGGNTYINQNSGSSSRLDFTVNGSGIMDLFNDNLRINGYILAGSNSDTNGVLAMAIRLAGDDLYNVWGSQYSSGKMMMGAKVKPKTGSEGFVSSADNAGFSREAVTMGSGLWQYYTAASATVAVGTDVTMTERVRFDASGNGHFDADVVAYSSTVSDERLKDNVKTIPNALDKVKALRGVEFDWNATSRKGKHDIGVIAQEVEEVLPEIVKEHTLCTGEFTDNEKEFKTVDYDKMIGVLIEAIKEQQVQIDELKTKLGE